MPEAIATTKRKFHRLLDSLTSYSNAPSPTSNTNQVPVLTARQKLEEASERARKRLRQSASTTSISTLASSQTAPPSVIPRKVPSKQAIPTNNTPPNFSPWSQERFLQRLQTFSRVSLWHPKPDAIGEVQWAKRGWTCIDVNTVACQGGCGRRVVVSLTSPKPTLSEERDNDQAEDETSTAGDDEEDEEEALEQALTTRYEHEIIEGHGESCLWRKAGCKDDIYRLPVVRPAIWQPELRKRYTSLVEIGGSIKSIIIQASPTENGSRTPPETLLAEIPSDVLPTSDAEGDVKLNALLIAMHGWRGSSESHAELLNCDACFQRIGLWMYQPDYRPRAVVPDRDIGHDDIKAIDLVEMHREYCPWRSADTQHATGSLAGMNASDILGRVITTYIREQRRRKEEDKPHPPNAADETVQEASAPKLSREEVDRLDKERESKLQKLKRMFSIKRSSKATRERS